MYILNWKELGGGNITFHPSSFGIHSMAFLKKLTQLLTDAGVPEDR